jgi:2-dehydro-3-deoxygluconokinase
MTDVLTLGETMGAFRAAGPFRLGGKAELTVAGAESNVAIGELLDLQAGSTVR